MMTMPFSIIVFGSLMSALVIGVVALAYVTFALIRDDLALSRDKHKCKRRQVT